jgi:hypothetical protein
MNGAKRVIKTLACIGLLLGALVPAQRALATWATDNCNGGGSVRDTWKRSQADNYAMQAVGEGYEFGGGCYKLNGYDDTPNTATDGGGEGADCSGFTFKTWALPLDAGSKEIFHFWAHEKNIHGPYSTWAYYEPAAAYPFRLISKTYSATAFMDALVERHSTWGHVALIHQEGSSGSDYIVHARNNTMGTEMRYLPYRSDADFRAVAREDWTAECYPNRCA